MVFAEKMGIRAAGGAFGANGGRARLESENLPELDSIGHRLSGNFGGFPAGPRGSEIVFDRSGLYAGLAGNLVWGSFAILSFSLRPGLHHVFLLWLLRAIRCHQELLGKMDRKTAAGRGLVDAKNKSCKITRIP